MGKRTATTGSDNNFVKAYFELLKLREDIARIEKSSRPHLSQPADRDMIKAGHRTRDRLQS
jgi:hypothetical protein